MLNLLRECPDSTKSSAVVLSYRVNVPTEPLTVQALHLRSDSLFKVQRTDYLSVVPGPRGVSGGLKRFREIPETAFSRPLGSSAVALYERAQAMLGGRVRWLHRIRYESHRQHANAKSVYYLRDLRCQVRHE